jgi:hypothetical protein
MGVAVSIPGKIGGGPKVAVGILKSVVGKCTIVGEGVMLGVTVRVGTRLGVKVTTAVSVVAGVDGSPAHACNKMTDEIKMVNDLRIEFLSFL